VPRRRASLLLAGAFAALAAAVSVGALSRVDQWAVDHLTPGGISHNAKNSLLDGLVPLLHSSFHSGYDVAVNIVTLPASFLISLAIVFACWRALGIAMIGAVTVEVICKEVLTKPALYDGSFHIAAFDSSFPSGHALRTVIVAAAIAGRWPRARVAAIVWAIASIVLLQLAGWHTPTDLAGGVLLAALGVLFARRAGALRGRHLSRRS
jgi:membrane-associated phospholipid phosphatase